MTDEEIEHHLIEGTQETQLRHNLGDATFEMLRAQAQEHLRDDPARELFGLGGQDRPNVYILPGIMGSKLSARTGGRNDLVWFDPIDIRNGGIAKLKFGAEPHPIAATGTFWVTYGTLRLRLVARGYKVRFLPFDWRQSIPDIGAALLPQIEGNGTQGAVLVAHSMGGLAARQMAAHDVNGLIRRVVTLGTPNYGSYAPVQVFRVASDTLNKVGWLDEEHTPSQLAKQYLRHFPGLVEMMPDPEKRPDEAFFDPAYWPSGGAKPNNQTLSDALVAKTALPAPDARFHQIIGYGQETIVATTKTASELTYRYATHGDGTVPVDLAQVDTLPQYFVEGSHTGMLQRRDLARAVHQLIEDGKASALSQAMPGGAMGLERRALQRSDDEVRQINRNVVRPNTPTAVDVLSEFLAPGPLQGGEGDTTDIEYSATTQRPRGGEDMDMKETIGGYPLSVLMQASETWRGTDGLTEKSGFDPRHRETDQRKRKYAARRLKALIETAEDMPRSQTLPNTLQEIVEVAEDSQDRAIDALLNERVMGEAEDFLSVLYLKRAPIVSKSVARIIKRNTGRGFGTGFMVAPGVLMTNQHVLRHEWDAEGAAVEFDFEISYRNRVMTPVRFDLRPDVLFHESKALDFALVAVEPLDSGTGQRALSDFGYLPLDGAEGKIEIGKPINIIQHPNAETKQAVFRNAVLQDLPANDLPADAQYRGAPRDIAAHYSADTKPGSSGSPVFNSDWQVIALHHSAVVAVRADGAFQMQDDTFMQPAQIRRENRDKDVKWVANEGIRISRIIKHLKDVAPGMSGQTQALVQDLLNAGKKAKRQGHFDRPLPRYALPPFEQNQPQESTLAPAPLRGPSAAPAEALAMENLLDFFRRVIEGGRHEATPPADGQSSVSITIDSAGVAQGSGALSIIYRGDDSAPYGRSATARKRDFDSIVLHHNSPSRSTDWLVQYQIDGDPGRGGHFGYHFYIDPDGTIFQGAPMTKRTNHVKPPGHVKRTSVGMIASNNSSIGITCVRAGPRYTPTAAQITSQDRLIRALAGAFGFSFANVFGHGEIQADRDRREGTSEAQNVRGWTSVGLGSETLLYDDDTDDGALD